MRLLEFGGIWGTKCLNTNNPGSLSQICYVRAAKYFPGSINICRYIMSLTMPKLHLYVFFLFFRLFIILLQISKYYFIYENYY